MRIASVALLVVLAALGSGCSGTRNILLSHAATNRSIRYREVEVRPIRACAAAPCPAGDVVWSGQSDVTGRITVPRDLYSRNVEVRVRGFVPRQGLPLASILSGDWVLDLKALPSSEVPPGNAALAFAGPLDAEVTFVNDAGSQPVVNRQVVLREVPYCETPGAACGAGEAIWTGNTDELGMVRMSKRTIALAGAVAVEGFHPAAAWDLRTALRNTASGKATVRLVPR